MIARVSLLVLLLPLLTFNSNVESFNLDKYRLPRWAFPDHYYINLDLRDPEADTFRGYSWININVTEENHYELVLNVDPEYIDVNSSTITVDLDESICNKFDYSNKTNIMLLTCTADMYGNNTKLVQFQMHYTAKFSDSDSGLFRHYYSINDTKKLIIFSQFESTKFRKVFPSFDEPNFKAPFKLSVDHYENLTVASNMYVMENSIGYNFDNATNFDDTPSMSSYLVAIVAGYHEDWTQEIIPGTNNFMIFRQRIHDDYISIVKYNAPTLLEKMGDYTGIKYEDLGNPTISLAALPGMEGAMENWGLLTFAESLLIDEGKRITSRALLGTLSAMAHEISHQWFGDYVTMNWWSETWLSEGFASYFEYYLADMLSTEGNDYEFVKLFVIGELQVALQADGPNALPLSNNDSNVYTTDQIEGCFDSISYSKGGSFIRMLRYALGEDVFKKGLQTYLKAKALGNAKASDIVQHWQAALPNNTDIDLSTYLDSWLHQPGYPVVKTSIADTGSGFFLVSLDIYKFTPSYPTSKEPEQSIWWVPISYITSDNQDPANATYFWINPGRTFGFYVPGDDGSYGMVNAGATGMYRVDYDDGTLIRFAGVLYDPDWYHIIPTENRAQLLDDLFNIAKYDTEVNELGLHRRYKNAFTIAQYLGHEPEYIPWYTYLKEAEYLLNEIEDELTENKLKDDILALIEEQLVIPDPNNNTLLPHSEQLKRNLLLRWAVKLGHTESLAYVESQYPNFLQNVSSVAINYREIIICYGLKNSKTYAEDYATLMKLYSKSFLPQERDDIVKGIACVMDTELLKSYLSSFLTEEPLVDRQYWSSIFKTLCSQGPEAVDVALDFLINNIDGIRKKWPKNIGNLFSMVADKIVKQKNIDRLQKLLSENSMDRDLMKAIKNTINTANNNVAWRKYLGKEITKVLMYDGGPVSSPITDAKATIKSSKSVNNIYNMHCIGFMLLVVILFKDFF